MTHPARRAALTLIAAAGGLMLSACAHHTALSVEEVHAQSLVLDAHADVAMPDISANFLSADGLSQIAPSKLKAGGVDAVVMSIAVSPGPRTAAAEREARGVADAKLAAVTRLIADNPDALMLATSATDVVTAKAAGKSAIILGFQNARALERRISAIDEFYAQGVRVFALTHLGHNAFADSSRPIYDGDTKTYEAPEHGGLSPLGKDAIKRINALGGIVDVSQLSEQATLQVLELSSDPIIASHSNVRAISDVSRNLSDEEIDRIGANGGVIHVAAFRGYLLNVSEPKLVADIKTARLAAGVDEKYSYPFELYWEIEDPVARMAFLTSISDLLGPAYVDDMVDHIDYIVKRIGIDHVGIGNDFNHGSGITGYADASEAMNITAGLLERGYTPQEIGKIWGGNFLRVMKAVEQ